ncbi:MAG: toll/interleukin-1 receptor domain-containing protein [Candidatus Limisoma sp.]
MAEYKCPICGETVTVDGSEGDSVLCLNCFSSLAVARRADGSIVLSSENSYEFDDDTNWDYLVDRIIHGEVIPVIGEGIILDKSSVREMLVKAICKKDGITLDPDSSGNVNYSYSQLIYHEKYSHNRDNAYKRISSLMSTFQNSFRPSALLTRILSIRQFPFVITTSPDFVVEKAMRKIWGDRGREVKTLVFRNRDNDDISSVADADYPTVYYMFGKANNPVPHSFVVTDEDMLAFCQSWLTEDRRPKLLSRVIGGKSLLFLGCNYPDWLVRFIWFSMRSDMEKSGMLVAESMESSLEDFMNRVHIETRRDPSHVVDQIEKGIEKKLSRINLDEPQENTDVFISYSRSDEEVARKLYNHLKAKGINVWYDRKNLIAGQEWLPKIKRSIESTKFFVAIISGGMKSQTLESHVYRKEWNIAIEHARGMGARRGFIIPMATDGVDLYDPALDLPDELTAHHALTISSDADYDMVSETINQRICELYK